MTVVGREEGGHSHRSVGVMVDVVVFFCRRTGGLVLLCRSMLDVLRIFL